jgi:hypothetical protein
LPAGAARDRAGVEVARRGRRADAPAGAAGRVAGDDLEVRVGCGVVRAHTRAGRDRRFDVPGRPQPERLEVALRAGVERGAQRGAGERGVERGRGQVEALVRSGRLRFGQPRVVAGTGGDRRRARRVRGPPGGEAQALVGVVVRARDARVTVVDAQEHHRRVVDRGGLGGARAGEAREQRPLADDGRLRVAAAEVAERALGQVEDALGGEGRHATPTWTSRKRAGAAPCETAMTWPGSPLPQFVRPQARQAPGPATASSEPQKRGVMPA